MSSFAFEICDVLLLDGRDTKITMVGPVGDSTGGLSVGDVIAVPLSTGTTAIRECLAFPLVNLGPQRTGWVRVTIDDVSRDEVLIGGSAIRQSR